MTEKKSLGRNEIISISSVVDQKRRAEEEKIKSTDDKNMEK